MLRGFDILALFIVVLCLIAFLAGHRIGQNKAYNTGYEMGYKTGQTELLNLRSE